MGPGHALPRHQGTGPARRHGQGWGPREGPPSRPLEAATWTLDRIWGGGHLSEQNQRPEGSRGDPGSGVSNASG